jgi:group II intron reverse transcriptase/maturase
MEPLEGKMPGTPSPTRISTKLERIAELARQRPALVLTTLAHHIDVELLTEAYRRTRKDGAVGVDGQTAATYAANLEENLGSLLGRLKSGTYTAPPVRRVHIAKGTRGKTRPIGIPSFEDKIAQRAVAMVLEAVYEEDFLPCSYGFRPNRSAHQALRTLWEALTEMGGGWILEVDIQAFFDTLDHGHLRAFLDRRVRDGVLRRMIDKWLKAGVLEHGAVWHPETGTPQGGVISPLLANIYLHGVLDQWFETVVKPRVGSRALLIRYADDVVLVFSAERDARRVQAVLPQRLAKYGLTIHPGKTRLVAFHRPRRQVRQKGRPATFDLLGFTHHWGKSWRGSWVVKRRTARDRFNRAVTAATTWCRAHRHWPLAAQCRRLNAMLRGHNAYFGLTGNFHSLNRYREALLSAWRKWLGRRNQRRLGWERFRRLLEHYPLASPVVIHSVYRHAAKP